MNTDNVKLKLVGTTLAVFLLTSFAFVPFTKGQTGQIGCESKSKTIKVVAVENNQDADAVFNNPGDGVGHFSSTPLLATTIEVSGRGRSCLVARFSAVARPSDNFVVYQVRVDGVPMKGHLPGFIGIATPVVVDAEETDQNLDRMVSHDFFAVVEPGVHRIEVLFAGCCSQAPPPPPYGSAGASVLTLEYTGN